MTSCTLRFGCEWMAIDTGGGIGGIGGNGGGCRFSGTQKLDKDADSIVGVTIVMFASMFAVAERLGCCVDGSSAVRFNRKSKSCDIRSSIPSMTTLLLSFDVTVINGGGGSCVVDWDTVATDGFDGVAVCGNSSTMVSMAFGFDGIVVPAGKTLWTAPDDADDTLDDLWSNFLTIGSLILLLLRMPMILSAMEPNEYPHSQRPPSIAMNQCRFQLTLSHSLQNVQTADANILIGVGQIAFSLRRLVTAAIHITFGCMQICIVKMLGRLLFEIHEIRIAI